MALDVHIIGTGKRWPENGSYTSFGLEDELEAIFRLSHASTASYPQIARMTDCYDAVIYEGEDLVRLRTELDQMIRSLSETDSLLSTLKKYRELCSQAVKENKAILLLGD